MRRIATTLMLLVALGLAVAVPAAAGPERAGPPAPPPRIADPVETAGRVTGRPLPRFVTIKRDRVNVRRGPGLEFRVDWEFRQRGMPVEVTAEWGHWRRVRDIEGEGGWVHYIALSGRRSAIARTDMAPLRTRADAGAPIKARAEAGAMLSADRCLETGWCRLAGQGVTGWSRAEAFWGLRPGEVFD